LQRTQLKIVIGGAFGELFFGEGDVAVVIKGAAKGRNSVEAPPHPFLEGFDF
jgi:hypothetical protein